MTTCNNYRLKYNLIVDESITLPEFTTLYFNYVFKNKKVKCEEKISCDTCISTTCNHKKKSKCSDCKATKLISERNRTLYTNFYICVCLYIGKEYHARNIKTYFKCTLTGITFSYTFQLLQLYGCPYCKTYKKILDQITIIKERFGYRCFLLDRYDIENDQILICPNNHDSIGKINNLKKIRVYQTCAPNASTKKYLTQKTKKISRTKKISKTKKIVQKLKEANQIAQNRDGKCLSDTWTKKLKFMCAGEHIFFKTLTMLKTSWCPECNIHIGEAITKNIFEILFEESFPKVRMEILEGLELDGYSENLKLAFEYDGAQHYKYVKYFHKTKEEFRALQDRDKRKNELCRLNDIQLIRVPYYIKKGDICEYIKEQCTNCDIDIPNDVEIDYKDFKHLFSPKIKKYNEIKKYVEDYGGSMIDTVYVDSMTAVKIMCKNEHEISIKYDRINSDKIFCRQCLHDERRDIKHVVDIIDSDEITVNVEKFNSDYTKLELVCKNGHKWYPSINSILYDNNYYCKNCGKKPCVINDYAQNKLTEYMQQFRKKILRKNFNYQLIDLDDIETIEDAKTLEVELICMIDKSHVQTVTIDSVMQGKQIVCRVCFPLQDTKKI